MEPANFIDKIMSNLHNMTADDVIQGMSAIYAEQMKREDVLKYPQFIQDIVFIIDLDTELNMQGDVLQNSIGLYVTNMITALQNIGALNDAKLLQEIYHLHEQNPDDEKIDELYNKIYLYTDFDIWPLLDSYVEQQKQLV